MANITTIEPIRYTQDLLQTDKSGLLVSAVPLDATGLTQIDGLTIAGSEPDGTSRRLLLKWGETWQRWTGSAWDDAPTQDLTVDSVLDEGNTAAELTALTMAELSSLAGNAIHVAIALYAADPDGAMPTAGFSLTGKSDGVLTEKTVQSPQIPLDNEPVEIIDVTVETDAASGGSVTVTAQADGGEWADPASLVGATASSLAFRAVLRAPTVGVSTAKMESVTVKYKTGSSDLATGVASVVSKTYDFSQVDGTPLDMGQAHLMVKRLDVPDTEIQAFLSLRPAPQKVESEILGVGDGQQKTYTLAHLDGIAAHTLKVYFGEALQSAAAYAFSSATGQVTCTAPSGTTVWVSYEYGWEPETWTSMSRDRAYPDTDNQYMINDQFNYVAGMEGPVGSVASVRVDLVQLTGTATDEPLGTGRGMSFGYRLAHNPLPETMQIKADGVLLDRSRWIYDAVTNIVTLSAASEAQLTATYDWIGRQPQVDSVACVWNLTGV
jgi:hypothetical protein